ncbi:MAG: general secretion pathway protein GspK [Gammaproteobacteria bacterium]
MVFKTPSSRTLQPGVALVLVLWVTVLLTIMAGAFTLTLQREAKLIGNLKGRSESNALAEAGLQYALLMLSNNDPLQAWKADRRFYEVPFNGAIVKIQIGDERGKIDLNFAGRELLLKMFTGVGMELNVADKLTDAILDWRDKNDETHLNGAEQKDYEQNNLPYAPRNGPFQSIEELQFVLGMTPQLFKAVEPMLTVYSHAAKVNKAKAPAEVLKILDEMSDETLSGQTAAADSEAQRPDEQDDETQQDPESDPALESDAGGAFEVETRGGFPEGSTYSIDATASADSTHAAQIRMLVRREAAAVFRILSWKYVTGRTNPFADTDFNQ